MKQFLNFLSLIFFFITYKLYDIYYASGILVIVSTLVLIYTWMCYKTIEKITLITFLLVAFFSLMTLYYHNAEFIKWKLTVIYLIFALTLLTSQFLFNKPLIKYMLYKEISLPIHIWKRINVAWAFFFLICSLINIYIAFWLPQNVWVNFKVFGITGLTLIFAIFNSLYIHHYLKKKKYNKNVD